MPHPAPFTPDVVDAVRRHMNDDHVEDTLLIARRIAGVGHARRARVVDLDPAGMTLEIDTGADRPITSRVPWPHTPEDRADIRHQIVELHSRASAG